MKIKFDYNGKTIEGELIYRKRKSMCIKINEKGLLEVIVPLKVPKSCIDNFLMDKAQWIVEKMQEMQKRNESLRKRGFKDGNTFMYLGEEYKVKVVISDGIKGINIVFSEDDKYVYIKASKYDEEKFYKALENWYRKETLRITEERVKYYSRFYKDKVSEIKVKEQKRRWASINVHNVIYFNWRISMAPLEVIDYIVVHEMSHMNHRDHSKAFWAGVAEVMPFYKVYHRYLKEHGRDITI